MELICDYRSLQGFLALSRKPVLTPASHAPIYLAVEKGMVLTAYCASEDFAEWMGTSVDSFKKAQKNRTIIPIEKDTLDQWAVESSTALPNFYEQLNSLRARESTAKISESFLFQLAMGKWSRLLPSSWGLVLQITGGKQDLEVFFAFRNQKLFSYFSPQRVLGAENSPVLSEKAELLRIRYLMPVQAVSMSHEQWAELIASSSPWKLAFKWTLARKIRIAPKGLKTLLFLAIRSLF